MSIQYIEAENISEAAKQMPWAFKVIKFEDGYIGFDTPLTVHLWKEPRNFRAEGEGKDVAG
jgi:hypothetical protein